MNDDKIALYARVSTENQKLDRQVKQLKEFAGNESKKYNLFAEKASSVKERPEFEEMMDNLEDYEYVAITKLDRFGRSLRQMLANIEEVNERSGGIVVINDQFDIDTRGEETMQQQIMRNLLSLFADVERKMIRQRMKQGYEKAREEDRVGRPKALSDSEEEKLVAMYESGRYSWKGLKEEFDISKATISKVLKERGVIDEQD